MNLIEAISQNNQEEFFRLLNLQKDDRSRKRLVNEIEPESGGSALYWAAACGRLDFIAPLIKMGANVNKTDKHGWTPTYIAAYYGRAEIITALKSGGAKVNKRNRSGTTPVCAAAYAGGAKAITALNAAGANVNTPEVNGLTPIYIAVQMRDVKVISALLEARANVNTKTYHGTPLELAKELAKQGATQNEQDIVRLLETHLAQYPARIKTAVSAKKEAVLPGKPTFQGEQKNPPTTTQLNSEAEQNNPPVTMHVANESRSPTRKESENLNPKSKKEEEEKTPKEQTNYSSGTYTNNAFIARLNKSYQYEEPDIACAIRQYKKLEAFQNVEILDVISNFEHNKPTRRLKEVMLSGKAIFGIFNVRNYHWTAFCILPKNDKNNAIMLYKDSKGNAPPEALVESIKELFGDAIQIKYHKGCEQIDGTSCGVFALENLRIMASKLKASDRNNFIGAFGSIDFCVQDRADALRQKEFAENRVLGEYEAIKSAKVDEHKRSQIRGNHRSEAEQIASILKGAEPSNLGKESIMILDAHQTLPTEGRTIGIEIFVPPNDTGRYHYQYRLRLNNPDLGVIIARLRHKLGFEDNSYQLTEPRLGSYMLDINANMVLKGIEKCSPAALTIPQDSVFVESLYFNLGVSNAPAQQNEIQAILRELLPSLPLSKPAVTTPELAKVDPQVETVRLLKAPLIKQHTSGIKTATGTNKETDFSAKFNSQVKPKASPITQSYQNTLDSPRRHYEQGQEFEKQKDFLQAFKCYQKSAESGYLKARTRVGLFYLTTPNKVVPEDKPKAFEYLLQSAHEGHTLAMYNVAQMLEYGDGVPRNTSEALVWYKKVLKLEPRSTEAALKCEKLTAFALSKNHPLQVHCN